MLELMFSKETMRKVFLGSAIVTWILLILVGVSAIVASTKGTEIKWAEMGIFVGALFTGLSGLAYMKKEQKKTELGIAKDKKV